MRNLHHNYFYLFLAPLIFVVYLQVTAKEMIDIDEKTLKLVKNKYGPGAVKRLESWQELVHTDNSSSDMEKLEKVNQFFNEYPFIDDALHWKQEDYWATPIEFIASLGGDCEDFSLAKYFTLKAMGVPEEKLYLTYVKALKLNQAHMVLTYYEKPSAEPVVLDNLNKKIFVASKRKDLLPVYSFNGDGLWLAKQRGKGKFVGDSQKLKRWQDLKSRMANGL